MPGSGSSKLIVIGIVLLAILGGGSAFYYQQQNTNLTNRVDGLTSNLGSSNNQVSDLRSQTSGLQDENARLKAQLDALTSSNQQLSSDVSRVVDQLKSLNSSLVSLRGETTLVSQGEIDLSGYGAATYIPFSVPSNVSSADLRLTFAVSGGYSVRAVVLSQLEHQAFVRCNCIFNGNYTETTWMSPSVRSYNTTVSIPYPGSWFLAFIEPVGTGSGVTITETTTLRIRPAQSWTTTVVSSGTVMVAFNGISYISFTTATAQSVLDVSFGISNFNGYYPQSVAAHLLNPDQYKMFLEGNYSSTTWSYPYATSLTTSHIQIPSTGSWYIAFQEQDPGGGFPATVTYTAKLATPS